MKVKLSSCPFCGKQIKYAMLFNIKEKKIFECKNCNEKSLVKIKKEIRKIGAIVVIFAALGILLNSVWGDITSFWSVVSLLMLFLVFYSFVPFFINLEKVKEKEYVKNYTKSNKEISLNNISTEATQVIPSLSKNFRKTDIY